MVKTIELEVDLFLGPPERQCVQSGLHSVL